MEQNQIVNRGGWRQRVIPVGMLLGKIDDDTRGEIIAA
jgi:hypothetical protein